MGGWFPSPILPPRWALRFRRGIRLQQGTMQMTFSDMIQAAAQFESDREIVKEIYRRWPNIRVKFLDPDRIANLTDKPFMICEVTPDGKEHVVFMCDYLDNRVIKQLEMNDQEHVDLEAIFERETARMEKEEADRKAEKDGEVQDLLLSGVKHFNKGKLKFRYTDEHGDKKVVG